MQSKYERDALSVADAAVTTAFYTDRTRPATQAETATKTVFGASFHGVPSTNVHPPPPPPIFRLP